MTTTTPQKAIYNWLLVLLVTLSWKREREKKPQSIKRFRLWDYKNKRRVISKQSNLPHKCQPPQLDVFMGAFSPPPRWKQVLPRPSAQRLLCAPAALPPPAPPAPPPPTRKERGQQWNLIPQIPISPIPLSVISQKKCKLLFLCYKFITKAAAKAVLSNPAGHQNHNTGSKNIWDSSFHSQMSPGRFW